MALADNTITWADVIAIAAELEDVPDVARAIILAHVNGALNPAVFGKVASLRLARILLAAHLGTYSLPGNSGISSGDIVSESVGGISRTYAAVTSNASAEEGGLDGTTYGQSLKAILRSQVRARLPRVF